MLLNGRPGDAGPQAASAAAIAGHQPPALYSVGRDGALFTWVFQEGSEHAASQQSQPSTVTAEAGLRESHDGFSGSSAPRPTATQSFFVDPWDSLDPGTSAAEAAAPAAAQHPWPGTASTNEDPRPVHQLYSADKGCVVASCRLQQGTYECHLQVVLHCVQADSSKHFGINISIPGAVDCGCADEKC